MAALTSQASLIVRHFHVHASPVLNLARGRQTLCSLFVVRRYPLLPRSFTFSASSASDFHSLSLSHHVSASYLYFTLAAYNPSPHHHHHRYAFHPPHRPGILSHFLFLCFFFFIIIQLSCGSTTAASHQPLLAVPAHSTLAASLSHHLSSWPS